MKTKKDNRIVVDLSKCQWARFYYRNQFGQTRNTLPYSAIFTVSGIEHHNDEKAFWHPDFKDEKLLVRAKRLGILDIWTPELYLKLTANAGLIYTGDKAVSMWEAWKARIFKKEK